MSSLFNISLRSNFTVAECTKTDSTGMNSMVLKVTADLVLKFLQLAIGIGENLNVFHTAIYWLAKSADMVMT